VLLAIYVGADNLVDDWVEMDGIWLSAVACCVISATLIGCVNIRLLLYGHEVIPLRRLLPAYWTAWAIGLVVPGQIGDMATLSVWLRKHGLDWHIGLGCTLLDKLISFTIILGFGLSGVAIATNWHTLLYNHLPWFVGVLVLILALLWRFRKGLLSWLVQRQGLLSRTLFTLLDTAERHPHRVLTNTVLTVIKVFLTGLAYWCMFAALGETQTDLLAVITLAAASSLVAYIPISFNGMGTVEITGIALFATQGLADSQVLSAYLALRVAVLMLAWGPVLFLTWSTHPIARS
jgi:uncharacterized membrane protein YbhN (UPF0104 family)